MDRLIERCRRSRETLDSDLLLSSEAGEICRLIVYPGKIGCGIGHAEMPDDDFAEHVAEIGRDREVAALVALSASRPGHLPYTRPPRTPPPIDHHRVAVAVVGAAIAVLVHRAPELRHRQDDDVGHAIAEVGDERRDAAAEVVEPRRELALRAALVDVRVPAADSANATSSPTSALMSCAICRSA